MSLRARRLTTLISALALVFSAVVMASASPAAASGTVTVTVTGQGSVTGDGISCNQSGGPDCSQFYANVEECDDGQPPLCLTAPPEVQLTAGPDSNGFVYDGFNGCDSTSLRTCFVTVSASTSVTARFRDAQAPSMPAPSPSSGVHRGQITLSASPTDNGGVTKVDFRVRGSLVGTDTSAPFQASFDTATVADGAATVGATAFDAAGNSTSNSSTITFDNTAPDTSITSGPADGTTITSTSVAFGFSATEPGSTFQCRLDGSAFGGCPVSYTGLANGAHHFEVRAVDTVGNIDASPAARDFTVDTMAPDTSLTGGPGAGSVVASRTVSFGFSATESGSFQCRLYPIGSTPLAFAACSGPATHTASGLADGSYRFEVRGLDGVGNVDASPAVRDFMVDATAPVATFTKQPPRKVKTKKMKAKVSFAFSAEPGATFRCSLDGAAFAACPSPVTYKVKAGKHTFRVVAVDAVGNVQASPTTWSFKVRRVTTHR